MCLASDIASDDQHIVCDKRDLVVLGELTFCLKLSPGMCLQVFKDLVRLQDKCFLLRRPWSVSTFLIEPL